MLKFEDYLVEEWKPALGCTERASIAYAVSQAGSQSGGEVRAIHLGCDPRMYRNCYAVGIPNSNRKVGIRRALAIGSLLPDPSAGLQVFKQLDNAVLKEADKLVEGGATSVEVDPARRELFAAKRSGCAKKPHPAMRLRCEIQLQSGDRRRRRHISYQQLKGGDVLEGTTA